MDLFSPSLIISHLYHGGAKLTDFSKFLPSKNVSHVVSITSDGGLSDDDVKKYGIKTLHIDLENEELDDHFEDTAKFITQARVDRKNVLVYCDEGISHSTTIVLGYLMAWFDEGYDEAYKLLRRKRPQAHPDEQYLDQLKKHDFSALTRTLRTKFESDELLTEDLGAFERNAQPEPLLEESKEDIDGFEKNDANS